MRRFYKYQGAGNDFIIFDNRDKFFDRSNESLVKSLCNRRFGVGADGLMLLEAAEGKFDFRMIYFNSDGKLGSMCGNGGRCMVAFAHRMGLFEHETTFLASDGAHTATLSLSTRSVKLQMNTVEDIKQEGEVFVLDTGSPHYVQYVEDLENHPVVEEGRSIRYSDAFSPEGINVNFVQLASEGNGYVIRTYERGVEDETFACGTGATAAAMAMAERSGLDGALTIPMKTRGGQLTIYFHKDGHRVTDVYLEGPAMPVFEGMVDFDRLMAYSD